MLYRRHRKLRGVPEGDVITKTEPETQARGKRRSTKGKTDQPTGENPTPAPESPEKPKPEPVGAVETTDGVEHVGVVPASAAVSDDDKGDD